MPGTPKDEDEEIGSPDISNDDDEGRLPEKTGKYYYDDAHGYQDYDPEKDDDEFND